MIKKIETSWFRKLTLNAKRTYCEEALQLLTPVAATFPPMKPYFDPLKETYNKFVAAGNSLTHPEFAEEAKEGDGIRDSGITTIKITATRSLTRKDEQWVKAGKTVLNALNDFNADMVNLPIDEETAAVDKFLSAIDTTPELKQALTTINCDIWVDDVKTGQQMVKGAYAKRTAGKNDAESAYNVSRQLEADLAKLYRYLNMKLEFETTPELEAMAVSLNAVAERFQKNLSLQETLRDNAKKTTEAP